MDAPLYGSTPSATVKQCSGKDNHDRLMALYHTGTDVKRHLLQYYLSQKKRDLAGYLYGKYQFLPPDDIKRALRTKNIQLSDLGIYAIDALLSDHCFDLFWDSCLDKDKTSLENILNRYKENLYRLYKTSSRDNNQSARNERKCDFLSKNQWKYLYNGPEMQEMQENDFHLSSIFPNKGLTTQSFDNDMNFVLLSNVCPLYQSLQVVTTNQMKLSRIAVEHEINNEVFDEIWELMATHLKPISSYCICETYFDHKLIWIKKSTFNCVQTQENRKCILESTFDNKTFSEDAEFMIHVQKELNLIEAENTKDFVTKLCDKEIPVLLVNEQYIAGSYPSAIEKANRKDLASFQSVCSRQATDMAPVSTSKKINVLEEQKNIDRHSYLRFVCLIKDVAQNVLVGVLKERLHGANFGYALNGMRDRLLPFLNGDQVQLLYPDRSQYAGDLSDMDVSLLYIILRNLGTIYPHKNGWGKDPEENDRSMSANIDRIRIAKNIIVSHYSNCLLKYAEFKKRWTEIRQSCVELGGEQYEEIIDNLLTTTFNSDLEQQFSEKLEKLKEMDVQNERYYTKLEEILDSVKEISVNLKKEQAFRESNNGTKYEEGFTRMVLDLKGNNIPGINEIEEKIGNYNNNDMHVISVESGSIIIRLQMFSSAFQSFGYVLTVIDKLLQCAFSARPVPEDDIAVCIILSVDMHQFSAEKRLKISDGAMDNIKTSAFKTKPTTVKDDVEINGYKGVTNKEGFYQLNIVCDSFVVDCIIDRKLERKCNKTVKEFDECKEEMKQWNESQSDFYEKVKDKFQNFVEKHKSCLCQYLFNTVLLKHTSNNAIETHILVKALYSSIENDDVDTAKFIGWQIARNFLKSFNVHVYDIWLASLCSCSRLRKKKFSWFCSSNVTIMIMVPHLIMEVVNIFSGLPVRQIAYNCETFKEAQAISEERAKLLEKDLNIQCHVPGPLAEKLFNEHRKLALVCPSEIKSINFQDFPTMQTFRNCSCIQLFCHVKGAIPIGEKHFPCELQGIQTDVIEGFPRFSSKHIRIGDSVTNTKVKGTLGGFCRFYGREAFLTCAHTMIDWDTLRSEESKHHMQLESVNLYTGDKILDETLLCGKVVNHSFTYDNSGDTSTDVALIEIGNGMSVSADDYVKTNKNGPLHYAKLGLKSRYLNDGSYIRSLDDLLGQNVEVVCAGATSGLNSSVSLISKVPQRILAEEDLQSASTHLETRCMEYLQTQVNMSVHMQVRAIIHESRKEEAESNRTVRFYKQLAVNNIPFQQGDSGACVYITNGYKETGCLGMAIADFPGGGCIVTPMVKLLQKLNIIKPSF